MIPSTPIWWSALPAPNPRLPEGSLRADVAVIGGGLAGLSTALHLLRARPGANVIVLEAERVGAGASGRSTGMLGPGVGQSLLALTRRLGPSKAAALYGATLQAVRDVGVLVDKEQIECELAMTGQLHLARSPGARGRLHATAAILDEMDFPVERLDADALARRIRLAPIHTKNSDAGAGPSALRYSVAGTLHPGKLVAELTARVLAAGGRIHEGARVLGLGEGCPVPIALDGSTVLADQVVITTAGYTPSLGVLRGRILPLRLQALVTAPLDEEQRAAIGWSGREGVLDGRRIFDYFRLTADDRVVFGGGAPRYRWAGRLDGDAGDSAALAALAARWKETFPGPCPAPTIAGGWTGVIGYTVDALPAICRLRGRPEVLHAVGWCGHGVALAVASGAWLTRMLVENARGEDLPWYRDDPPLVPFELARWLGFRASVGMMSLLDRVA